MYNIYVHLRMERLKEIRKELCVPQKKVAEWLKISTNYYSKIEKRGCKNDIKKQIICCLIVECNTMNITKKRLADLVKVHRCNLYKYKGSFDEALEQEKKNREKLKKELNDLLILTTV